MTMNGVPIQVGQRIKTIRTNQGKTMEDFGKLFLTSKGTVNNWEKGRNLPNKDNLKSIADLGGITVDELLYGKSVGPIANLLELEIAKLTPTDDFSRGLLEGLKRAKALLEKKEV